MALVAYRIFFVRPSVALLVVSLAVMTAFSAGHHVMSELHHPAAGLELGFDAADDPAPASFAKALELAACATGLTCHVQIDLNGAVGVSEDLTGLAILLRPDPADIPSGQIVGVLSPPPLALRA